jgi:LPS-assembly protein
LKYSSFIFSAILAILRPELACAEETKLSESNADKNNQIALKLDQEILPITAPTVSETSTRTPKVDLRIKLRMSKSINNFDGLNTITQTAEIDPLSFKKEADAENDMLANGAVIIEGDRLEVQLDRSMTSLGNASLKTGSNVILGDRIEFDSQNHTTHSAGHASMTSPDSLVKGPSFHLNIDDGTGEMPNASFFMYKPIIKISPLGALGDKLYGQNPGLNNDLLSGVVDRNMIPVNGENKPILGLENTENTEAKKVSSRGDAEMLFFEGTSKRRLLKSRYTTCEVGSDDWYIKSGQLKINDETKTAVATNATVEFKGVPILFTPWINFPYANQRKSGLLAPLWGTTTKSGFEILTPFYWNISPNMDATLGTRYLSKRGIQSQGELRYLEENYAGIVTAEYLPSDEMTNKQRYFAKIKHQHNFGNGWTAGVDAQKVSDDQYFSDLSTHIITTSKVNLLQQANINYADDVWQFGALAQKYQTLDKISYPYQRMPQMTLNGTKDWDWGTSRIQNQLTRFESDPSSSRAVKAGTRFSTYPSISIPMIRPYGYITPKIGINYTSYSLDTIDPLSSSNYDKTADRTLPIVSLDSGLFFERDTRIVSRIYTQTLEPRLFYVYIPYQDQSRLPIFDTGVADLNMGTMFIENQYTGGDRINNANQISMSLSSRLIDAITGEQRFATSIGQRFYFEDQKVCIPNPTNPSKCADTDPLRLGASSDIVVAATARLINKWNIDAAWQYNNNTGETVRGNIGTRYSPEPGKVLNLSYRFTQNNLEQINASTQWPLGRGYYGLARANYSIREGSMIEGLAGIEYDAGCWQSRFVVQRVQTATADANFAMFFQLELGGMASIGSNPLQLINRNIPGYKSSGLLPDNYRQLYNE